jgi:type IV secretory pathway VirB3-like protein
MIVLNKPIIVMDPQDPQDCVRVDVPCVLITLEQHELTRVLALRGELLQAPTQTAQDRNRGGALASLVGECAVRGVRFERSMETAQPAGTRRRTIAGVAESAVYANGLASLLAFTLAGNPLYLLLFPPIHIAMLLISLFRPGFFDFLDPLERRRRRQANGPWFGRRPKWRKWLASARHRMRIKPAAGGQVVRLAGGNAEKK